MLVLGGGLGGLSAAHYLLKQGIKDVKIIEATNTIGGWIRSIRDEKSGLLFEKGPRTIRVVGQQGYNMLSLIEELGIADKVKPILRSHPSAKNRMIYVNNTLYPIPNEPKSLFKTSPPFSKPLILSLFRDLIKSKKECDDDNIYDFVERRFGGEIANYLISPLICGICAGDAKEISVKLLMPGLFESEQKFGSVGRGMVYNLLNPKKKETVPEGLAKRSVAEKWSVYGLDGGLSELPKTIRNTILKKNAEIICGSKVTDLSFKDGSVTCKIGNDYLKSDHVICSLPSRALAPLVRNEHPQLSEMLSSIPYVSVAVVNLAYKGKVMKHEAFGFLIPPSQKLPVLGVIFDTCSFPQGDWTILTVMLGGRWFDKYIGHDKTDNDLLQLVNGQIKTILGIDSNPDSHHVSILKECIPQYVVGHFENVNNIFSYIKKNKLPISLCGSSYRGVGVNDVLMSAKVAVDELNIN